ncbi:MAG: hypothetical protein ABI036_17650 [Fibrobacteria bacterium]
MRPYPFLPFRGVFYLSLLGCLAWAYPQMPPVGDFHYVLNPRSAAVGQPVTFEAFRFEMCLYSYDVSYALSPTPISSKLTWWIDIKAKVRPQCATAAGYSGPRIVFDSLKAGAYIVRFDSTSDFREDLGDTSRFEIMPPSALRGVPGKAAVRQQVDAEDTGGTWRLNGSWVNPGNRTIGPGELPIRRSGKAE